MAQERGLVPTPGADRMPFYPLTLYVSPGTAPSQRALAQVRRLCDEDPWGWELEVVDVDAAPQRAASDEVVCVPTLLRHTEDGTVRLVGDLGDRDAVRRALRQG